MLITLSRRAAICHSFAEVQLTGVAPLGAVSHRFNFYFFFIINIHFILFFSKLEHLTYLFKMSIFIDISSDQIFVEFPCFNYICDVLSTVELNISNLYYIIFIITLFNNENCRFCSKCEKFGEVYTGVSLSLVGLSALGVT